MWLNKEIKLNQFKCSAAAIKYVVYLLLISHRPLYVSILQDPWIIQFSPDKIT